jgi:hypothetical protein
MSHSDKKIRQLLDLLFEQLKMARGAFLVAKYIYDAKQGNRINSTHYFFSQVYQSCLESSILALSRLLVQNSDSINFDYLLECVKKNIDSFPHTSSEAVKFAIAQHREQLENYKSLILKIKNQRDKTIAHLDKKHVNNLGLIFKYPPISEAEIEKIFDVLMEIINAYGGYLTPSQGFHLDVLAPNIHDDIEFVIERIGKKEPKIGGFPN